MKGKILIVDDEKAIRDSLKMVLTDEGFKTESASDGLDALEKVCGKINVPVFALGGVKSNRIEKVMGTGVHGAAMISEILRADNIRKNTEKLIKLIEGDNE